MNQILQIIALILVGGLIGWTTNKLAIKMLFRPIKPVKFIFTFQGVLPKRKDQISESIAETIQREFLDEKEIIEQLVQAADLTKIKELLKVKLVEKIKEVVPSMMIAMFGNKLDTIVAEFIDKDGDNVFNDLVNSLRENGTNYLDIKAIVAKRIDALDFEEFEELVYSITKRELRHIEYVGLILGLLIGVVQSVIILFT